MKLLTEGDGSRDDRASPTPPLSARVRLEVAFLDADYASAAPAPLVAIDERACQTVLVVTAEADLRGYIRECLRERRDLRVVEAVTVIAAAAVAANYSPNFLVVDEPQGEVVVALSELPAIVIIEDAPGNAPASGTRIRRLARPFTAVELLTEVGELMG